MDIQGRTAGVSYRNSARRCVVGNGYPYPIETADANAVITGHDREKFLRAIQEFSQRERLQFRISRKANSKTHRR
jgi:hypothetical protein